ncbi:MAG TPA: hypothetical protein VFP59_04605 [Candidatus Angelobacter sp.]|nr:hypothetical protein [Candidatus Angelobacter sp.]
MKISWIILSALLIWAYLYVNRHEDAHVSATTASTQQNRSTSQGSSSSHRLAASMQSKINYIEQNGRKARPDQRSTVMTEDEINDYLASGQVELPKGVNKVRLEGHSGQVTAFLTVDFDKIREGQQSSNPLMGLFSGVHDVTVDTNAAGTGGEGRVHVNSVSLDGTEIPHMAVQYFVDKYVTSKYPNVGMDSHFRMPDKIDTATVGYHKLTVTQK